MRNYYELKERNVHSHYYLSKGCGNLNPAKSPSTWWINVIFVLVIVLALIAVLDPKSLNPTQWSQWDGIHVFKTMLISIILEALPFLLVGIIVSSILQVFVPEAWIRRIVPKNPLVGVLVASLLGIIFPICECGLIPIVRRLVAKGMPLYAAITFILAGPIVNPVVYSATFVAFRNNPEMVYARMGLAIAVSMVVGLLVLLFIKRDPLKPTSSGHSSAHVEGSAASHKSSKINDAMKHAGGEFFDMGKYLILGSLITALIQSLIPRTELLQLGQGELSSNLFMMGFAYMLSLCSTSDAFVAYSFSSTFSVSSLLAFLVFGPMIDLKGTLMLLSGFKARFVLFISITVALAVLAGSLAVGHLFLQ